MNDDGSLSMREEFRLALTERDVEDARSNARIVGDARSEAAMSDVLGWLRGGGHPSADVLRRNGRRAD